MCACFVIVNLLNVFYVLILSFLSQSKYCFFILVLCVCVLKQKGRNILQKMFKRNVINFFGIAKFWQKYSHCDFLFCFPNSSVYWTWWVHTTYLTINKNLSQHFIRLYFSWHINIDFWRQLKIEIKPLNIRFDSMNF